MIIKKLTKNELNELQQKYPLKENDHFLAHYVIWRPKKINKLIKIMGRKWFNNKKILELGCGYGYIGIELQKLGAIVSFAEGYEPNIPEIKKRIGKADIYLLDQDKEWEIKDKFDLVINWGVSYHLDNWKQDLKCSINHAPIISLETEVLDPFSKQDEIKIKEGWFESAINGIGNRTSTKIIEEYIKELNREFIRYDDYDLDCINTTHGGLYEYSWKEGTRVTHEDSYIPGLRRFWMIYEDEK